MENSICQIQSLKTSNPQSFKSLKAIRPNVLLVISNNLAKLNNNERITPLDIFSTLI